MDKAKRLSGLDLLRCVAMMMVVVLHYLGKGGLLADLSGEQLGSVGIAAWLLEAFCIVAVNVYMFISGYFLSTSSFKLSRLLNLWLQVWFYSVVFGLIGALTGVVSGVTVDTHYFLTLLFPVSMGHYWFMTAYVFLYLLLPFISLAIQKMTKAQMQVTILSLLTMFCVIKSVMPVRFEMDGQGYDCLWYLCVFVVAAYVRKFGVPFLAKKGRCVLLYVIGCIGIFGVTMGLRQVYLHTGRFDTMLKMCMEYNHILPFLAAAGLTAAFIGLKVNQKAASIISKVAPHALGVYLLHENIGLRYSWQKWLGADRISNVLQLLFWVLIAVVAVFVCGILVDMLRAGIFKLTDGILGKLGIYRKLKENIAKADAVFVREN